MSVVKKHRLTSIITFFALTVCIDNLAHVWPTNTRNDPFPVHSAWDPHYFLYEREKQLMFGMPDEKGTPEYVMLSISPFGQNADTAKKLSGTYCAPQGWVTTTCPGQCNNIICNNPPPPSNCPVCINTVNIGDIDGRWNLLGLLAGKIPANKVVPPLLEQAFTEIFGTPFAAGLITSSNIQFSDITPNEERFLCEPLFGYVSVPLKYRKRGIRWNFEAQLGCNLGFQFLGGAVEISQVLNPCFINLTNQVTSATPCTVFNPHIQQLTQEKINCFLFDPLIQLAQQLGLDLCNFTKWGFEDFWFSLYWRHATPINFNFDLSWPRLLVIPFFRIGASVPTGHPQDPSRQFSLPFGNNGSFSVCGNAGINFDFSETVEFGGEVGYVHFFSKEFADYRMPTNVLQSGIFPWATDVKINFGDTAYVAGKLAAYHFIDRLSFWGQWVFVHHRRDHITLLNPDPAFIDIDDNNPLAKCDNTTWRAQLGNFALTYDISPNFGIGVVWQQMFHARNVYNATTIMFTLNLIF